MSYIITVADMKHNGRTITATGFNDFIEANEYKRKMRDLGFEAHVFENINLNRKI